MFRRIDTLRMLAFAGLVSLAACIIDNDPVRIESFAADPAGTFVFSAQTNTVMTPNDDGDAERIRRDRLAEELNAHGMGSSGYVVELGQLFDPHAPTPTK